VQTAGNRRAVAAPWAASGDSTVWMHCCTVLSVARRRMSISRRCVVNAGKELIFDGVAVLTGDEPRISHVDVAKRLGYARSNEFLRLVRDHKKKLSSFGVITSNPQTSSKVGGRPSEILYLNRKQVLYLCAKSEQDLAVEVTIQMVHAFDAALSAKPPSRTAEFVHRLLLPVPTEWDQMFSSELVRSLIILDGHTWNGGPQPRYLRSTYSKIYDLVVGSELWEEMGRRAADAEFLRARKHQQLQPGPRAAFRAELEVVRALADQSRSKEEFWSRMDRRYGSGILQLGFGSKFDADLSPIGGAS
jgi:hypothetical protein